MEQRNLGFQFIAGACCTFIGKNGAKLLYDLWLVDEVFEGNWCRDSILKN